MNLISIRKLRRRASSHMARRTFIGNLYKQVKAPNLVVKLLPDTGTLTMRWLRDRKVKKSELLVCAENDILDASRIAEYAYTHREKLKLYQKPSTH